MKYKIGQKIWILTLRVYKGWWIPHTSKHEIIKYYNGLYYLAQGSTRGEKYTFLTEEDAMNSEEMEDVFVSSKNCLKSELKYKLREYKLKRILDV